VPPPGYTAPSKIAPGDLPANRLIDASGSFGNNFNVVKIKG